MINLQGQAMNFKNDNKNIGKNIRLYRIKAGYTVKSLCKKIQHLHGLEIKPGSIRNYEKGTEKVPAVALNSIATITSTDIKEFYEDAYPSILLNGDSRNIHLLEAYNLIRNRAAKDNLLHMARMLSKK
jgi:transcriptional regulator with XRE-family HTH domain